MFLCVFAWPKGGHVENVVFSYVFARSKNENVEKCYAFMCFLGKVEKCSVSVCFGFLYGFLLGRKGEMSKSVVFVKRRRVFNCFLGKVSCWALRFECTTYYIIYIYINI